MRPLRILSIGGAQGVAVQMRARALAARGHRVAILSPQAEVLPDLEVLAPRAGHGSFARRCLSYAQMVLLLWRWRPDVVVVHFAAQPFAWLLPLVWRGPLVVSLMGGDILFEERRNWSPWRQRATLGLLGIADLLISMSPWLLAPYPALRAKALFSSWGVDTARFAHLAANAVARDAARERFALPRDVPLVLSPRRLVPVCNVLAIVAAMPAVRARIPDARLVLLEDGPDEAYRERVKARIAELGLGDAVHWLARVDYDSMPTLYGLADVMVSVARSDGLSLSVLEAMASGTPVVLGDIPNYAAVFSDGVDCLKAGVDAPDEIAARIVALLEDQGLRARVVAAARVEAGRSGDLAVFAAQLEARLGALRAAPRATRLAARLRHALTLARIPFDPRRG